MTSRQIAQGIAGLGRNGDSVLVHMQPQEVAGLQAIAHANGTSLTRNPDTGMPEAFSLGGFFRQLLPFAAGAALAPMTGGTSLAFMGTPIGAGLTIGATTAAVTGNLEEGLMAGLGAAGGANLSGGIMNAANMSPGMQGASLAQQTAEQNARVAAGQAMSTPYTPPIGGANLTTPVPSVPSMAPIGPNMGQVNPTGMASYGGGFDPSGAAGGYTPVGAEVTNPSQLNLSFPQNTLAAAPERSLDAFQKGFSNIVNADNPWQTFKTATGAKSDLGAAASLAMPLGGAVLGGLEPEDLYGSMEDPMAERRKRWGQPLNLDYDTGLRLAAGGPVAFDDGGSVPGSRLSLREEEQQMQPVQAEMQPMVQQMQQPQQTELGLAALKPNQENEVKIEIAQPQLSPQNPPLLNTAQQEGIPAALEQLGGQGVDFEKLYGRTQGAVAPQPMQPIRGYGPNGQMLAAGGTVQQGGLMDLYGVNDSQYGPAISQQGYGLGRLNTLAAQQSQAKAEMGQYAKGGGLEDGGFVIPADVVSGLGNGSTDAGLAVLAKKYGAKPIKGNGDGMSDSIATTIEGREKARVADGEAYIPKAVVKKLGGPEKLYAMMDRVRKARTGTTKQGKEINPHRLA